MQAGERIATVDGITRTISLPLSEDLVRDRFRSGGGRNSGEIPSRWEQELGRGFSGVGGMGGGWGAEGWGGLGLSGGIVRRSPSTSQALLHELTN